MALIPKRLSGAVNRALSCLLSNNKFGIQNSGLKALMELLNVRKNGILVLFSLTKGVFLNLGEF